MVRAFRCRGSRGHEHGARATAKNAPRRAALSDRVNGGKQGQKRGVTCVHLPYTPGARHAAVTERAVGILANALTQRTAGGLDRCCERWEGRITKFRSGPEARCKKHRFRNRRVGPDRAEG